MAARGTLNCFCVGTQLDGVIQCAAGPSDTDATSPLQSDIPSDKVLAAVGSHTLSMAKEGTTETLNFSDTSGTSSASTCTRPGRGESCDCGSKKAATVKMQKLGRGAATAQEPACDTSAEAA